MAKVLIEIGWKKFVVDAAQAIAVSEMLSKAEMYERKYVKNEGGKDSVMHYVYPQEDCHWNMDIMPENVYRMAKLAGKPKEE